MIPKWWCLMIVFSAFMIQVISFGTAGAIGLYNIEFIEYFNVGAAEVSLIGSINLGVFLGAGPFVSLLMRHMSYRRVAVIGSLLSTISLLCVPFLDNIIYLYIIYGIFTGLGFAMVYLPSSVLAGLYFNEHRSLATGIATSGSGIGAVIFPLLVHSLIQYYGWKGSVFILAGLSLQCIVFSALLFPLAEIPNRGELMSVLTNSNIHDKQTNNHEIDHMMTNGKCENYNGHISISENDKTVQENGEVTKLMENFEPEAEKSLKHCYVLCDFSFFIFFLNNILWNMGVAISWILAPEYFVSMGLTKENAATILTFGGVGCFIGCIIGGGLGNIQSLSRLSMYISWNIAVGILIMFLPFKIFQSVEILSLIMFLNGLGFGGILGLLVIFTVDLLGEKALGDAFGYLMLSNGVGSIIGPPLGGAFKDILGTYDPTFFFAGTLIVVAGLLMFLIPIRDKFVPRPKKTAIGLTIEVNLKT
ncbi:monocarboxylate transporter 14-like [Mytilus californianus]|uniref:monocarboxylate transporter 14-like n=1 Tax=Mytilus californianus TaxID=6549 RepID=UPI0022471E86|nr:monocarboxylate transporter 14-like [Mytilus californianus]